MIIINEVIYMSLIFKHKIPNVHKLSKKNYYLAIIGSRSISNRDIVFNIIYDYVNKITNKYNVLFNRIVIITGGARGVDSIAEEWAKKNNLSCIIIKPDWSKYGKSAGFKRNINIIKPATAVLAIISGGSKGTLNSISLAKKMKKPCTVVNYDYYIQEKYDI